MSKYDELGRFLSGQFQAEVPMTFSEIERVTGAKLPPKAQNQRAWWSNNPSNNVMTKIWLDAGFETAQVDIASRKLIFRRIARVAKGRGMADEAREFKQASAAKKEATQNHPLIGALKGTFTIEPGWDLTKPTLDPEEMAEWEASLDRKADLYEKGLSRKS